MKQPKNDLKEVKVTWKDDDSKGDHWVDVICGGEDGGFCNVGVGCGKTIKSAYKAAAKRLYWLADKAERLANRAERTERLAKNL